MGNPNYKPERKNKIKIYLKKMKFIFHFLLLYIARGEELIFDCDKIEDENKLNYYIQELEETNEMEQMKTKQSSSYSMLLNHNNNNNNKNIEGNGNNSGSDNNNASNSNNNNNNNNDNNSSENNNVNGNNGNNEEVERKNSNDTHLVDKLVISEDDVQLYLKVLHEENYDYEKAKEIIFKRRKGNK